MTTQILYSKEFSKHNNSTHPENAERLFSMINEIKKAPIYNKLEFVEPELLPEKCLYDVHSCEMIQQIKDMSSQESSWIDLDTYICKEDYVTARLAAGGLVKICKNVMNGNVDNAFALIRPPGHHATRDRSMGFCIFNNAAIAANEISKEGKRVLVFDHDVHHGNGTQHIMYERKDVMYQSLHLYPHYPGTGNIDEIGFKDGEGYTINAPLSHGNGDIAVSQLLDEIFLPIAFQFKPDIVIFSSGFDSHHLDTLGGLKLTSNFFGKMIAKFQEIQPRIVCTLEGGYNIQWIGKCLLSQLGQMVHSAIKFEDSVKEDKNVEPIIEKIKMEINKFWNI
ncbi:MAG: histone deacetylase [Thermoplasmatales archaeon]|nr:MAG: histone deacetylase [Thermoplasmatales archaeon]